jgi:GTP-binding protein 1
MASPQRTIADAPNSGAYIILEENETQQKIANAVRKTSGADESNNNNNSNSNQNNEEKERIAMAASSSSSSTALEKLPQEVEEGNVEYKLQLLDPSAERFEKLVSQLKWRLAEGQGEAIYELGAEDDGTLKGLDEQSLAASKATLQRMCDELDAECSLLAHRKGVEGRVAQMLVRTMKDGRDGLLDLRMAVCGNVDSGKSTLCGVLTSGQLDNGRGRARVAMFKHQHEIECGRTSSVSEQIMGFDAKGNVVNYAKVHGLSWSEIAESAVKVISFFDLAGHEKYLKTTISGMTGHMADYALLLVGANMGVTRMTREHLGLVVALRIPLVVVITKIDICPPNVLKQTIASITRLLKMRNVRRTPFGVKNRADVVTCVKSIGNERFVPVFRLSSVTGDGVDLLRHYLNLVPPRLHWSSQEDLPAEVLIDDTFHVTGVGTVVGGTVVSGNVYCSHELIPAGTKAVTQRSPASLVGSPLSPSLAASSSESASESSLSSVVPKKTAAAGGPMLLGPDGNGKFREVHVRSIHARRTPVRSVRAGQSAGFALKKVKRAHVRKGMVLVHPSVKPVAVWGFEAKVVVLYHSTTITVGYAPVIACLTVRQAARVAAIVDADKDCLRTGERATLRFVFMYRPEYLKVGMRAIFREGKAKGCALVTKIFSSPTLTDDTEIHGFQSIAADVSTL